MATASRPIVTIGDLLKRLGDVPADRVRFRPVPGTATVQDIIDVREREGKLCELVDGILLEKTMGAYESRLAGWLLFFLNGFLDQHDLGYATGADGGVELAHDLIRIPDVAVIRWDRVPGGHQDPGAALSVPPNLAVEVLSRSNTPGEMAVKRQEYFAAGVQLVWEIDPKARTVAVYTSPTDVTVLEPGDTLTAGDVLPGFSLAVQSLFERMDRHI